MTVKSHNIPRVDDSAVIRENRRAEEAGARALAADVIEQAISDAAGCERLHTTREARIFLFGKKCRRRREAFLRVAGVTASDADFRLAVDRESAFREWRHRILSARDRLEFAAVGPVPSICAESHAKRASVTREAKAAALGLYRRPRTAATKEEDL